MTTLPRSVEQESISAFSEALGMTSGHVELADSATSLRAIFDPKESAPPMPFVARIVLDKSRPRVIQNVVEKLNRALALPRNWDSYGGKGASPTATLFALSWFDDVYQTGLPAPSVVPGSDGSIQLEWHMRGVDFEVLFLPSGGAEFAFGDHESGVKEEGHLDVQNRAGRVYIERIASRAGH